MAGLYLLGDRGRSVGTRAQSRCAAARAVAPNARGRVRGKAANPAQLDQALANPRARRAGVSSSTVSKKPPMACSRWSIDSAQ